MKVHPPGCTPPPGSFRSLFRVTLAAAALALLAPPPGLAVARILDNQGGLPDLDVRTGKVAPNQEQLSIVTKLGAHATWNRFGTPGSLIRYGGYLAKRARGNPVDAARTWIRKNRALFRLTEADVGALQLLSDSPIVGTSGHAVIFRQEFGALPAAQDGMITVGINRGRIFYVSSSAAGTRPDPAPAVLTATAAWLRAAASVGRETRSAAIRDVRRENGWTVFSVDGFSTPLRTGLKRDGRVAERARPVALPMFRKGVKTAYETIVLDLGRGNPIAYKVFVDARTGAILLRLNAVDQLGGGEGFRRRVQEPRAAAAAHSGTFAGTYARGPLPVGKQCGPDHPVPVDADSRKIGVAAAANDPASDIVLYLKDPAHAVIGSSDETTSPEAIEHSLTAAHAIGDYYATVCESASAPAPATSPAAYSGVFSVVDQAAPSASTFGSPAWRFVAANPPLGPVHPQPYPAVPTGWRTPDTDVRASACWFDMPGLLPPCSLDLTPNTGNTNPASRTPWDVNVGTNTPTFTTIGNNTATAEAWSSPLTVGPDHQQPADLDRTYGYMDSPPGAVEQFTNAWNKSKCDAAQIAPGQNDVLASAINLFSGNNRFHDFAYNLGFTEQNFTLQTNDFGQTASGPNPLAHGRDPELGGVQAGALGGGFPAFPGRDNATQITLDDGLPGITNAYLFQPVAGSFYSPCVDGGFDTSVFGHEYAHAVSNRMVGGPDANLTGRQARSMGEGWSDQNALEYMHEYGFDQGGNGWAEGVYVSGNHNVGIRDYALNNNPLNYGDIGFDVTGPEVHADGEIWNAVGYELRQALVRKYNAAFPGSDAARQRDCASGAYPARSCPGNRRWIQTVYDAFLLMQPNVSMLDARDAYLAADRNRFGRTNQCTLWGAFAKRGLGSSAATAGTNDPDPVPGFDNPRGCSAGGGANAAITFDGKAYDAGSPSNRPHVDATVYVGLYERGVSPIADTDPSTPLGSTAKFVPGTYTFMVRARGYGLSRVTQTLTAGQRLIRTIHFTRNWASAANGASATASDGGDPSNVLDDTEGTNWTATTGNGPETNVNVTRPSVVVKLGGGEHPVRSVRVSAMLQPGQSRFEALRRFQILTCDTNNPVTPTCTHPTDFSSVYASAPNTSGRCSNLLSPCEAKQVPFPGVAPRPVAPNLILRSFEVADTTATHVKLVVLDNQCTGGHDYQGEQDTDPTNPTDCSDHATAANTVRMAELEVFSFDSTIQPPDA